MFTMNLQLFGGGKGGSTQVIQQPASIPDPTPEERELQRLQLQYAQATAPNALRLNQMASNQIFSNPGVVPVDYTNLASTMANKATQLQSEADALGQGNVNPTLLANRQKAVGDYITNQMGGLVSGMVNKGVSPGGSSFNNGLDTITKAATSQLDNDYMNLLGTQSNLLEQRRGLISAPMEYLNAAQNASVDIPTKLFALSTGQQAPTTDTWRTMSSQRFNMASPAQTHVVQQGGGGGLLGGLAGGIGNALGQRWF